MFGISAAGVIVSLCLNMSDWNNHWVSKNLLVLSWVAATILLFVDKGIKK